MSFAPPLNLAGVFPPLTTPFATDESLALERLKENISRYNRTRLAGYVLTGSTGESVLFAGDEAERLPRLYLGLGRPVEKEKGLAVVDPRLDEAGIDFERSARVA